MTVTFKSKVNGKDVFVYAVEAPTIDVQKIIDCLNNWITSQVDPRSVSATFEIMADDHVVESKVVDIRHNDLLVISSAVQNTMRSEEM